MPNPSPIANPSGTYIDPVLGRYECTEDGHHKFWECLYETGSGSGSSFLIRWGKIGANKPQSMRMPLHKAQQKIQEKTRKGYKFIPGSFKTLAEQQCHAITEALAETVAEKEGSASSTQTPRRRM